VAKKYIRFHYTFSHGSLWLQSIQGRRKHLKFWGGGQASRGTFRPPCGMLVSMLMSILQDVGTYHSTGRAYENPYMGCLISTL
jgi:hypothetical protein